MRERGHARETGNIKAQNSFKTWARAGNSFKTWARAGPGPGKPNLSWARESASAIRSLAAWGETAGDGQPDRPLLEPGLLINAFVHLPNATAAAAAAALTEAAHGANLMAAGLPAVRAPTPAHGGSDAATGPPPRRVRARVTAGA